MNKQDLELIHGFIIKSEKLRIKKELHQNYIKNFDRDIRFKNLPIKEQYSIIKYLDNQFYDLFYYSQHKYYKKLINLIAKLHNNKINNELTKLLLLQRVNKPYPLLLLKRTNLTFEFLKWLIEDHKKIRYVYILEIIENKKLKQEFLELYNFLTL